MNQGLFFTVVYAWPIDLNKNCFNKAHYWLDGFLV